MSKKYEAFPGMEDLLPGQIETWHYVEDMAQVFFESRGFKEIRTPVVEPTELFVRSIGESSDIVHKEMYTFQDRGGRSLTMRPEMTASVGRSVIEHGLLKTTKSLRLYYLAPMFRAERPQAGRKRQFHQIGVEMVNETGEQADIEILTTLYYYLRAVGVTAFELRLNDLGNSSDRAQLIQTLTDYFRSHLSELCDDCKRRYEQNVLRVLDCKIQSCQPVINKIPWEALSPLSQEFKNVTAKLDHLAIPYKINRRLVRGLDYYNGLVFEVGSGLLGAQDALAGGGRYDGLYEQLGGQPTPCTGFSIGVERLLGVLEKEQNPLSVRVKCKRLYAALLDDNEQVKKSFFELTFAIREKCIHVELLPGEMSLSKHLKRANQMGIRFLIMLGAQELQSGKVILKDLNEKTQREIPMEECPDYVERMLKG